MSEKLRETAQGAIYGTCDSRFERVLDQFAHGFDALGELGASVCITYEGKTVVDIWGGVADPKSGRAWDKDTVTTVFSCTKGATALVAHKLSESGQLDLDAPVTEYWPEYGAAGKDKTTVKMMLDHTSGVPAFREPVKEGGALDWDYITGRIAAEEPFFEPGSRLSYHGLTYAWTIGPVIRRAAGKPMSEIFRTEIAQLLDLDFTIAATKEEAARIAERYAPVQQAKMKAGEELSPYMTEVMTNPTSIPALFILNTGGLNFNNSETHMAEIGSANALTNGRGLAGLYRPLALGGDRFVSASTLSRMARTSSATHRDGTLYVGTRFGLGFMRSIDNRHNPFGQDSAIIGERAFGHVGAGGSIGFADPDCGLSFGYAMNQQGLSILLNPRGQGLIDAAYRSIGYTSNVSGAWNK